jgi:hypothetical protein
MSNKSVVIKFPSIEFDFLDVLKLQTTVNRTLFVDQKTYIQQKNSSDNHIKKLNVISHHISKSYVITKWTTESGKFQEINNERKFWYSALSSNLLFNSCIDDMVELLSEFIEKHSNPKIKNKYDFFMEEIITEHGRYISESNENTLNKFTVPSSKSLLQLIRFLPDFPDKNLNFYIDEMSGCFGVIIKPSSSKSSVLNLLMKENMEIVYSYVKRRNKIMKIRGVAYFNDDLNDSDEIRKIIGFINECY